MRELWGTFSVRDHLEERPFVADLMLYDRLVLPVPADQKEWERWEGENWEPARQRRLLGVLDRLGAKEQLTLQIPWDEHRRRTFRDNVWAAQAAGMEVVDGYAFTAGQLLRDADLKRAQEAEAVKPRVVAAYTSRQALEREIVIEEVTAEEAANERAGEERLAMAVGRSFLVPDVEGEPSEERDLELFERAARLAVKESFRRKRSAYNDWVDEVLRRRLTDEEAIARMDELLKDYEREVKQEKVGTRIEQAFLVGGVAAAVAGHFFPPAVARGCAARAGSLPDRTPVPDGCDPGPSGGDVP
jgi:hypothetical protein